MAEGLALGSAKTEGTDERPLLDLACVRLVLTEGALEETEDERCLELGVLLAIGSDDDWNKTNSAADRLSFDDNMTVAEGL